MDQNSRPRRILRIKTVLGRTGDAQSSWYALVAAGKAPKPVPLGPRAVGWVEDEIEAFIEARIAARDAA